MKIAVIGGGNMGTAMIRAWIKKNVCKPSSLLVFDRNKNKRDRFESLGVKTATKNFSKLKNVDIVLIAVKPQDIMELLRNIKSNLSSRTIVVSVAVGITMKKISSVLGDVKIVRAMPNTPVQIEMGITGWSKNENVTNIDKKKLQSLFGAMGQEIYFAQEKKLDVVAAISGSGPAYIFYFMEALFDAAINLGLTSNEATRLVLGTFVGSSLLVNSSDQSPEELRKQVTSKGGTTQSAIGVFDNKKLKNIISEATKAACKRAGQLNSES